MEISNNTFSAMIRKYETEAKIEEAEQTQELTSETPQTVKDFAEQQYLQAQEASANSNGDFFVRSDGTATTISNINLVSVGDAEDVDSTEETNAVANGVTTVVQQASSYSNTDLDYIKELIYNSHHSFIANFRDADTFFDYVNAKKDSTITKETGISRAQLVSITQNDIWEDNHQDFFGLLNRSFYSLDKSGDGYLSYDELKDFLNKSLKKGGYNDYKNQVQAYADEVQNEIDNLKGKAKINKIIDLTKDYLNSIGSRGKNQLDALERLLKTEDQFTASDMHVGQRSFKNLPKGTGGCYVAFPGMTYSYDGKYDASTFLTDQDDKASDNDCGIVLNSDYLSGRWEYLVDVLVHELTHATWYQYSGSNNGPMTITEETLTRLYNMGVFKNDEEFELAKENFSDLKSSYVFRSGTWYENCEVDNPNITITEEGAGYNFNGKNVVTDPKTIKKLEQYLFLVSAVRDEYVAYQVDADYLDSIGGDELQVRNYAEGGSYTYPITGVNGDKEKEAIEKWIAEQYDPDNNTGYKTSLPDWKWWSYA